MQDIIFRARLLLRMFLKSPNKYHLNNVCCKSRNFSFLLHPMLSGDSWRWGKMLMGERFVEKIFHFQTLVNQHRMQSGIILWTYIKTKRLFAPVYKTNDFWAISRSFQEVSSFIQLISLSQADCAKIKEIRLRNEKQICFWSVVCLVSSCLCGKWLYISRSLYNMKRRQNSGILDEKCDGNVFIVIEMVIPIYEICKFSTEVRILRARTTLKFYNST